jgi:DNA-binding response OmpR family regulator
MTATDLARRPLGGARVLVATGDPDDSASLTAVLRLNGFDASEARTAEAALAAASAGRPAVVVLDLDLDLPDGGGCALIRRVRRLPEPPSVVVVTGHTKKGVRLAATAAGASTFLLKPADPVELAKLVTQLSDRP